MLVKFLFYLLRGKNLIPNLKTKYCRCCCVGWMELGQLWQLLHVKNGVKHFLIIFCFAVLVLSKSQYRQMEMQAITQSRILQLEVAQISHSQKARQNEAVTIWLKTYRAGMFKYVTLLMNILNYLDYFPTKCKQTWRGPALSQFFVSSS